MPIAKALPPAYEQAPYDEYRSEKERDKGGDAERVETEHWFDAISDPVLTSAV